MESIICVATPRVMFLQAVPTKNCNWAFIPYQDFRNISHKTVWQREECCKQYKQLVDLLSYHLPGSTSLQHIPFPQKMLQLMVNYRKVQGSIFRGQYVRFLLLNDRFQVQVSMLVSYFLYCGRLTLFLCHGNFTFYAIILY